MNMKKIAKLMVNDLNAAIATDGDRKLDKVKIIVDETSIYRKPETGEIYIGGQLVESKPQEVIHL